MKIEITLDGYPDVRLGTPIKFDGKTVATVEKITRSGMRTTLEADTRDFKGKRE